MEDLEHALDLWNGFAPKSQIRHYHTILDTSPVALQEMPACVQLTPKRVSLLCDAYSRILADTQQPPRTHPTATSGTHTPTHHGISVFCVPGIWITSQRHIAVLLRGNCRAHGRQARGAGTHTRVNCAALTRSEGAPSASL
eukprot:729549-Prymnesium_polylepis.3